RWRSTARMVMRQREHERRKSQPGQRPCHGHVGVLGSIPVRNDNGCTALAPGQMNGDAPGIAGAAGRPHRFELEHVLVQTKAAKAALGSEEPKRVSQLLVHRGDHALNRQKLSDIGTLELAQTEKPAVLGRLADPRKFLLLLVYEPLDQTHSSRSAREN